MTEDSRSSPGPRDRRAGDDPAASDGDPAARPDPGAGPDGDGRAIQIGVRPVFLAEQSSPEEFHYVWAYHVRIENLGSDTVQLFWRHWLIHDPVAGDQEVQGEGVVGQSPWLEPGDVHQYQSFCILRSPLGHMEGFYHFRSSDGSTFRAPIPRFHLTIPLEGDGPLLA